MALFVNRYKIHIISSEIYQIKIKFISFLMIGAYYLYRFLISG